jgi:hypothetical protein
MMKEGKNVMAMEAMQGAPKPKETAKPKGENETPKNPEADEAAETAEATTEGGEATVEREKTLEEGFVERQKGLWELRAKRNEISKEIFSAYSLISTGGDVLIKNTVQSVLLTHCKRQQLIVTGLVATSQKCSLHWNRHMRHG